MKYVYLVLFLVTFFTLEINGGNRRYSSVKRKYVLRSDEPVARRTNSGPICVLSVSPDSRRGRELMAAENGTNVLEVESVTMAVPGNDSVVPQQYKRGQSHEEFGTTSTLSPAPSPGTGALPPEQLQEKPSVSNLQFVQIGGATDDVSTPESVPSPGVSATIEWTNSGPNEENVEQANRPTTTVRPRPTRRPKPTPAPTRKSTRATVKPSRATFQPTSRPTYKPAYRPKPPPANKPSYVDKPHETAESVSPPASASFTWGSGNNGPPSLPNNRPSNRPPNRPQNRPPNGPPHYPDYSGGDYDYAQSGGLGGPDNAQITVVTIGSSPSSPGPAPSPAIGSPPGPHNNYQGTYEKPQRPPHGGSGQRPPHRPHNKPPQRPPPLTYPTSPSYPTYDRESSGYVSSSSPGTGTGELKSIDDIEPSDCIEVLRSHGRKPSVTKATSLRSSLRRNSRRRGLRRKP